MKNFKNFSVAGAFSILLLLTTSCSSIFYYPDKEELIYRESMPRQPEDVFFQSEDGVKLHGWYFKSEQKPKAVILFFHGNAQNLSTHFLNLYAAPLRGYPYFIFDYRGYGQSEGSANPKGLVRDGRSALRWIKKRHPDVPIVIFGQSLGGAVALKTVLEMQKEIPIQQVIVDSTYGSYRSVARKIASSTWLLWLFQPVAWLMVDNSQEVISEIKNLSPTPLLVIHGDADRVVNFSLGEDLFNAAAEPKEFWKIPNGNHTDFMLREKGKYAEKFFSFLDARFVASTSSARTSDFKSSSKK